MLEQRAEGEAALPAPAARSVSVIVPVYFNAASLPELFDALRDVEASLQERDLGLQLIFVDDGSGDDSFAELLRIKAARPATTLVKLTRNFGAVPAIRTGCAT